MRKTPTILAGVFLVITLTRVAVLVETGFNAGLLGWLYSAGLGFGVYLSSYFMRVSASRKGEETKVSIRARWVATACLIFFVAVDGVFNLVEVLRAMDDQTLLFAAWIYGLFPTIAVGLLGVLQGYVDRLPSAPIAKRPDIIGIVSKRIAKKLDIPDDVIDVIQPKIEKPVLSFEDFRTTPKAEKMKADKIVADFGVSLSTAYIWKKKIKSPPPY